MQVEHNLYKGFRIPVSSVQESLKLGQFIPEVSNRFPKFRQLEQ